MTQMYYKCYHKCYDKPQCTQHDCVWVCLCVHLRACACVCMRARMCGCVCVCSYIYIYLYVYVHLSVCLSVCLFIYLSFYLSCISCNNKQLAVMHKFDLVMTFTYILRSPKQIAWYGNRARCYLDLPGKVYIYHHSECNMQNLHKHTDTHIQTHT